MWGGPGLELVSLGPPHSGRYTCRLTIHAGRAEAWANMLVFSPHSELEFQQRRLSGGAGVRLSCRVAGTFPRPELRLTRGTETLQPDSATTTSTMMGTLSKPVSAEYLGSLMSFLKSEKCSDTVQAMYYRN